MREYLYYVLHKNHMSLYIVTQGKKRSFVARTLDRVMGRSPTYRELEEDLGQFGNGTALLPLELFYGYHRKR